MLKDFLFKLVIMAAVFLPLIGGAIVSSVHMSRRNRGLCNNLPIRHGKKRPR